MDLPRSELNQPKDLNNESVSVEPETQPDLERDVLKNIENHKETFLSFRKRCFHHSSEKAGKSPSLAFSRSSQGHRHRGNLLRNDQARCGVLEHFVQSRLWSNFFQEQTFFRHFDDCQVCDDEIDPPNGCQR